MTRKHYIAIAAMLKALRNAPLVPHYNAYNDVETRESILMDVATHLAIILSSDNAAFDRARFLAACGYRG